MRKQSAGPVKGPKNSRAAAIWGVILFAMLGGAANAQTDGTALKIAGSPRPVLQAVIDLTRKYGYVITYEDPPYVYQGDMKDVTLERRDLSRYPAGKAPKTYELIGGSLTLTLPKGAQLDESAMYGLLERLVQSWFDSGGGGGHFQAQQQDGIFHIVPTEVRDRNGNWQSAESILNRPISLPKESRDDWQTYKAIGRAVSAAVGVRVITLINSGMVLGGVPDTKQYALGAQEEPASSVLLRAFNMMKKTRTWYLLYEPTLRAYVLDVNDVSGVHSPRPATNAPPAQAPSAPSAVPQAPHSTAPMRNCPACSGSPPAGA